VRGAHAARSAASLPGIVVDNDAASRTGEWTSSGSIGGFIGGDYLHDDNAGKGERSVTFTPELPREGDYEIRLHFPGGPNRAADVPVTVKLPDGPRTFRIDQRKTPGPDGLPLPGRFQLPAGKAVSVTIGTAGTTGHVIVDAVQFIEPAAPKPR
jgi:hypothetical protein